MKLGIILHRVPNSNIFIVDVGWGQLRYFASNSNYNVGDYVLYELYENNYWGDEEIDEIFYEFYENREDWLKGEDASKTHSDANRIKVICRFDDCDYQGNIRFDVYRPSPSESDIVIARRNFFVYWKAYKDDRQVSLGRMETFDKISNSLLFLSYAEPRYPMPDEMEFLKAYSDARKKVDKLDIPKMIEELKVETYYNERIRKGVMFCHKGLRYNYSYHYDYLHDHYLDSIFPKYSESLYSSKDDKCEYIHPKYEDTIINKKPDGSFEFVNAKFDGVDIDVYCANKTKELRQVALENYEKYNKDEHINSLAYSHIYWSKIFNYKKENELILKMKGLAEVIWGFKHQELIEQITIDNYQKLIQNNNSNHPIPQLPD